MEQARQHVNGDIVAKALEMIQHFDGDHHNAEKAAWDMYYSKPYTNTDWRNHWSAVACQIARDCWITQDTKKTIAREARTA